MQKQPTTKTDEKLQRLSSTLVSTPDHVMYLSCYKFPLNRPFFSCKSNTHSQNYGGFLARRM